MAVVIALVVIGGDFAPWLLGFQRLTANVTPSFWASLIIFPVVIYLLVWFAVRTGRESSLPAARMPE
jgi:fucose permease